MQDMNGLTSAQREMEEALRQLRPLPAQMNRDRLMFEAGRRSMRRNLTAWRATAAVFVTGIGLLLFAQMKSGPPTQPGGLPQTTNTVVVVPDGANRLAGQANRDYLDLRTRLLTEGPDALTTSNSPTPAPVEPDLRTREPCEDSIYSWRSEGRS
jgi:hypothetical protein